jgi:methoxymalonate biosynthesis protein
MVVSMADRFGPHGAVGVMLLGYQPSAWHLKLLATSCRVVSFGAGAVILNWLIDQAAQAGTHLVADFRPTERNRMMEIAYRFAGFTDQPCSCLAEAGTGPDQVQRLHITPQRRPAPATVQLRSPVLASART